MEFSKATVKAKVLFFSERRQFLLLRHCRRREFDTVITTGTPMAWGEVSSSSSTAPSPSLSPARSTASPSQLGRSEL
jgi:hypothetical protein